MDARFHPAIEAINRGNLKGLIETLGRDPALATARSSVSHPTLLQCLVLEANGVPAAPEMASALIQHGADIDEPLIAAASIDNVEMVQFLLESGASIDGNARWSPLEEALYWGSEKSAHLLLSRGAAICNLRIAAGLGRMDAIQGCFESDGALKTTAGRVESPFAGLVREPQASEPQAIIDNAFIYACMHGHIDAANYLIARGAAINSFPLGFHFPGTGLHYAAHRGQLGMVEHLLKHGADPTLKDPKVHSTPAGWAEHVGHMEVKELLQREEQRRRS
jgi:ankyrin repeat protein